LGTPRFANFGTPLGLAFTPNSKVLVVGSWDGFITVWDLQKSAASLAGRTERNDYGLFIEIHLVQMWWQALIRRSESN
jgi:WD40 repeat protein